MAKTKGMKTKFSYGDAGQSTTFTDLANVVDVTPPTSEVDDIETTNMDSPDGHKEYEPGLIEGGESEVVLQYVKADHAAVVALLGVPKAFKIEFSDGAKLIWQGYVKSLGLEIEREGIITTPITVKVSGKPAYTGA